MDKLHVEKWAAGLLALVVATFFVSDPYIASNFQVVAISALVAVTLRFVLLMGELNFATAAFVGLGAYSAGVATTIMDWPFLVAILAGGVAAGLFSIVFGLITLRTKGPYFLLIGFAFTEAVRIVYSKLEFLGGNSGMVGIFPPMALDPWMPMLIVSMCLALIFGLYVLERSDFGKILVAIRDNENVARTVGINVLFCKVACFAIASFVAGIAGSLHAFSNGVISPGDFSFLLAAFALAYVKVGGEERIIGPVLGAILLVVLSSYMMGLGGKEHIFYGAAIVLAVLFLPKGLTGLAQSLYRLRRSRGSAT